MYTKWFPVSVTVDVWHDVANAIRPILPNITPYLVEVCSNRAGLHFAAVATFPPGSLPQVKKRLKAFDWKESKK